ncbi:MAG: M20 family metallopeptidase [Chloroflexi bacterium]|nr:M20 family metallopeptidase [Chloroflexota bacterium]
MVSDFELTKFVDKYQLALETALTEMPEKGICGFELEWNLLDQGMKPLLTVGAGSTRKSFVEYLRDKHMDPRIRELSTLEIFHWMIEMMGRPYYSPKGAVYEARFIESIFLKSLDKISEEFNQPLHAWHGNLLYLTEVDHESIPISMGLAKRRYLERCIDLYGVSMATTGNHVNLSLPEPLIDWDFLHLPQHQRNNGGRDEYFNQVYITATRLMRAFSAMFIAAGASTPMQAQERDGKPVVILTEYDSIRNLTFPNPDTMDLPNLYRSHQDYVDTSFDLVRRGVRFGNNNWSPVRARSFAESVERQIEITNDQLEALYARGLYAIGSEEHPIDEVAARVEMENILTRIKIPMSRVEIRTDDGGSSMSLELANLTLKHLLLLRMYADKTFCRGFRYDNEDIERVRRNEISAAKDGLRSKIENPITGKPIQMREFLSWSINEVKPLAEALGLWGDLQPLVEMAKGAPNTADQIRTELKAAMGDEDEVPLELLKNLVENRKKSIQNDMDQIIPTISNLAESEIEKIGLMVEINQIESAEKSAFTLENENLPQKTIEILQLSKSLVEIPSVTASPTERLSEVRKAYLLIKEYLEGVGVHVRVFEDEKYPAILAGFTPEVVAPVMLSGHFDVVEPEPDDTQFIPRIEGDYFVGRGTGDMKTVVATYMVWMKDILKVGGPPPPVCLLLIGNEENGEMDKYGSSFVLDILKAESGYEPKLFIAGERTEISGENIWGTVDIQNRGLARAQIVAHGEKGHSGVAGAQVGVGECLVKAQGDIKKISENYLKLESEDGWHSQLRFPFIEVGTPGIYNITAEVGKMGMEIRSIPQDDLYAFRQDVEKYCENAGLNFEAQNFENGVACDPDNPYLEALLAGIKMISNKEPKIGRKLAGTSARFAPNGQGIVWGQSGLGPHAANERHYIPSILPYYEALIVFGEELNKIK